MIKTPQHGLYKISVSSKSHVVSNSLELKKKKKSAVFQGFTGMSYSKSHFKSQISLIFFFNFETDLRLKELIR